MSLIVERLKEYMEDANLNCSTLAKQIGFDRVTLSGVKNGAHTPSTKLLIALCEYFKCSADYLLGIIEYPPEYELVKPTTPFNLHLKYVMKSLGITRYSLEKKFSKSLVQDWLNGTKLPSVPSLITLADYMGCSIDFLLGRTD